MDSTLHKVFLILTFLIYPLKSEGLWEDLIPLANTLENRSPHCGFHTLLEAYQQNQQQVLQRIHDYRMSIGEKTYDTILSPSGHFLINYETSGTNAIPTYDRDQNGTPDYLEFVAKSFDRAWEVEVEELGFRQPPDASGGPIETYPIFCGVPPVPGGSQTYGATFFDPNADIASLPGLNFTSEIWINIDFSFVQYPAITNDPIIRDSLAIAVTAAHEFNHALQLGYRIWVEGNGQGNFTDLWFIENSATFMEEVVADEVNDYYQYLRDFFFSTDQGLTYDSPTNLRIYGEVILNIMAAELYGKSITRQVWQEIVNQPAAAAIDRVFEEKGSSLQRELQRLAEWMFFSGNHSIAGQYFDEAENYPDPDFYLMDDYSTGLLKIFENQLPPFSIQYVKGAVLTNSNLNIYFAPEDITEVWSGVSFGLQQPFSSGFPSKVYAHIAYPSIQSNDDSLFTAIISGNWNDGRTDSLIQYSLYLREFSGNLTSDILVYPSVIKPSQGIDYVTFKNVPPDSRIEIFSGNGTHISTIRPQFFSNSIFWNLQTFRGDMVGSGIYIYSIVSPTMSEKGKIVVIR